MKQTRIVDISSHISEEDLRRIEAETPRRTDRPRTLLLDHIEVADKFFQRRVSGENQVEHDTHSRELVRVLRDTRKSFTDPLVVMPIGGRFFLIDGHYRLTAYRTVQWSRPVRVVVFEGDLDAAWEESLRLNVESKRPMSLADKLEAAWTLTVRGKRTRPEVAERCAVSDGTIGNMRRRVRELRETGEDPAGMSWREAKHGKPKGDLADEDWLDKFATEWAERFVKSYGSKPCERPDILAAMLFKVDAGLPRALINQWRGDVRGIVDEWDTEEAEDPF